MKTTMLTFEEHGDDRGTLVALEQERNIPFEIKRCYYMYDTVQGVRRGFHAHKTLKQVLVCVKGQCKVLLDDGKEQKHVLLDSPNRGLYIESDIWREMYDFSEDAVLMVLASELYDESDYIRDYQEFLKHVGGKQNGD